MRFFRDLSKVQNNFPHIVNLLIYLNIFSIYLTRTIENFGYTYFLRLRCYTTAVVDGTQAKFRKPLRVALTFTKLTFPVPVTHPAVRRHTRLVIVLTVLTGEIFIACALAAAEMFFFFLFLYIYFYF